MKSDLNRLLEERGFAALVVAGDAEDNHPRHYLTNGAHITGGLVIQRRDAAPLLFVNPMETAEAAKSGLTVYSYYDIGYADILKETQGDRQQAEIIFWARCLEKAGVGGGKIAVYGMGDLSVYIELVKRLNSAHPQYEFVGDLGLSLFDAMYVTKDTDEIARIRSVAQRTSAVLAATWDFIAGHRAHEEMVVQADGTPLTIGAVKRFVRRALLDRDLQDTAMIFAQGRDGGFPHSRGEDDMALRLGQAIVFDLFPREIGGGYHHDCTRTWSIGYATPAVQQAFNEVHEAFEVAVDSFRLNMPAKAMQEAVQSYLESKGHPTARSHPGTTTGYVHGLGHGVGLKIHERPLINHLSQDTLVAGNVITIEPGVYYPERGFGVRIEDMCWIADDGQLVTLTDFHKELVLPLKGAS
ncbi:MAG: aminopeptidase P family protein [Chloroflexi bacterium]|nr:aminopeptidase P family protein [Chloroflexota bacterium]